MVQWFNLPPVQDEVDEEIRHVCRSTHYSSLPDIYGDLWDPDPAHLKHNLTQFAESRPLTLWQVAKLLIDHGAALSGQLCSTVNDCLSAEPRLSDLIGASYHVRNSEQCSMIGILEMLEYLVPEQCQTELFEIVEVARQKGHNVLEEED